MDAERELRCIPCDCAAVVDVEEVAVADIDVAPFEPLNTAAESND